MKAGDVAFSQGGGLAGWLIRTGDHSRYNHTRLVLDEAGTVAEAVGGGFIYGTVKPGDVVASPPMTDAQRARIPAIAHNMIGLPYGYLDVIALGFAQLGFLRSWTMRRITDPTTLFCSQGVDEAWWRAGFHAFTDGRLPHNVTPGDIADLALRQDWETEVIS